MSRIVLLAILLAIIFISCSSSIPESEYSVSRFAFEFDNKTFYIISYTHHNKVGYNLLASNKEDTHFSARDLYQDGTIDLVVKGPYTLDEANLIYAEGLRQAKSNGNLQNREIKRKYKTEDLRYRYLVTTYLPIMGHPYNTFTVMERIPFAKSIIFKDEGADGSLDSILFGKGDLDACQKLYNDVLEKGLIEKFMEKSDTYYLVAL